MANQKLKDKKKKTRERKNKVHVQKRRDAKHREDKKKKEWEEQMERDSTPEKLKPFVRPEKLKKREEKRDAEIKLQLDRNIKILQALEEQYLKEQQHKTDLGAELAAEGFNTIEEKLDILNKRAQEQVEE